MERGTGLCIQPTTLVMPMNMLQRVLQLLTEIPRSTQALKLWSGKREWLAQLLLQVLLTSFEILMKDQNKLAKETWQYIIVDEAHRSKTFWN